MKTEPVTEEYLKSLSNEELVKFYRAAVAES
jgi:hypothetical protein